MWKRGQRGKERGERKKVRGQPGRPEETEVGVGIPESIRPEFSQTVLL